MRFTRGPKYRLLDVSISGSHPCSRAGRKVAHAADRVWIGSKLGPRQGSPDLRPIKRFASSGIAVLLQDIRGDRYEFGIRQ